MPDIELRFHKDMLVLSSPVDEVLLRQGFGSDGAVNASDVAYADLVEPEAIKEALRMNIVAGAQCLVAPTAGITPARLRASGLEDRGAEIVRSALKITRSLTPQHVLVEIAPCDLPLDPSSKNSLNEHRDQYARAARFCAGEAFDGFFLNGFKNPTDLKCALMGVRQVSDAPIVASVDVVGVNDAGVGVLADGHHVFAEALAVMGEYGATVAGFATPGDPEVVARLIDETLSNLSLPVLAQLVVREVNARQGEMTNQNPYFSPDVCVGVAAQLRQQGVQFLRAAGHATPAFTSALVAATAGFDVVRPDIEED